jgi:hypothetical protein
MVRAVAAALALTLLTATPATGAKPRRASLELDSIAPLMVSGRGFGAGEAVLLAYAGADGSARTVRVSSTKGGRFRAFFRLRLERCDSFTIRATGAKGSRAVLQVDRRCEDATGPPKRAPREPRKPEKPERPPKPDRPDELAEPEKPGKPGRG